MIGIGGRDDNIDILTELLEIIEILFADQTGTDDYMKLKRGLTAMNKDMSSLVNMTGGLSTNGRYIKYLGYAEKILDLLASEVPGLLKNEDFFTSTLYKETP